MKHEDSFLICRIVKCSHSIPTCGIDTSFESQLLGALLEAAARTLPRVLSSQFVVNQLEWATRQRWRWSRVVEEEVLNQHGQHSLAWVMPRI